MHANLSRSQTLLSIQKAWEQDNKKIVETGSTVPVATALMYNDDDFQLHASGKAGGGGGGRGVHDLVATSHRTK